MNTAAVWLFCLACHVKSSSGWDWNDAGVISAQMQMYTESAPRVVARSGPVQGVLSSAPAAVSPVSEALDSSQRPAGVQQPYLYTQAGLGQHQLKQEQLAMPVPSLQSGPLLPQASQPSIAEPQVSTLTPAQSGMFIPKAPSMQRGLDHRLRTERRTADQSAMPSNLKPPSTVKQPRLDSPGRASYPFAMNELIETDMF